MRGCVCSRRLVLVPHQALSIVGRRRVGNPNSGAFETSEGGGAGLVLPVVSVEPEDDVVAAAEALGRLLLSGKTSGGGVTFTYAADAMNGTANVDQIVSFGRVLDQSLALAGPSATVALVVAVPS